MNKILVLFLLVILSFSSAKANDLFSYDQNLVAQEMATIDQLEENVLANPLNFTSESVSSDVLFSIEGVNQKDDILGIPSFAWGFCCGLAGIVIVYVGYDDEPNQKEESKKAITGCVVGTAVSLVIQLAIASSAN